MIIIIPCNVYLFFFSSIVLTLINLYLFHVYRYPYKKKLLGETILNILGVVLILLLNVMEVLSVGVASLLDILCMVFQRMCVLCM